MSCDGVNDRFSHSTNSRIIQELVLAQSCLVSYSAQLGALYFNWELRKYQEVESSDLVTDYKQTINTAYHF